MSPAESVLFLRRVKISKFAGVAPTELFFRDEFNVLLGKNATGKTTLLGVIAAIVSDSFDDVVERSPDLELEYDVERRDGHNVERATFRLSLTRPHDREELSQPARLATQTRGELRVTRGGVIETFFTKGPSIVDANEADLKISAGAITHPQYLYAEASRERPTELAPWQDWPWNRHGRLDEALGTYSMLLGGSAEIAITPAARPQLRGGMRAWSFTAALRDAIRANPDTATQSFLRLEHIPALQDAALRLGFSDASAVFLVREAVPTHDGGRRIRFNPPVLMFRRGTDEIETQETLSFGQRRLLAFLIYWHETQGAPAVMDELVNGLHHEWVTDCLSMLRQRQCFFASQNPLLLDELRFSSSEELARTFVVCDRSQADDLMRWSTLTARQVNKLWKATQAGVQHVHEILRDEGLW